MTTSMILLCSFLASAASNASFLEPQTVLHYRGRLAPAGTMNAGQTIEWYLLAGEETGAQAKASRWLWVLEEAGRGGWDWTRRWGTAGEESTARQPSLNFSHDSGSYVVPLPRWQWNVAKWREGIEWRDERRRLAYRVTGPLQRNDHSCWQVTVRTPIGVKRTLWIDRDSGILRELHERVFMGRGEKYDLVLKLASTSKLDDETADQAWQIARSLRTLEAKLGKRQDAGSIPWSEEQLTLLTRYSIDPAPKWPPLKRIMQDIARDRRQQQGQTRALGSLAGKAKGRDLSSAVFRDAEGKDIPWKQIGKRVTVLHFWEYRHSPLRPPYGQVGFLDFLSRQHSSDEVAVVGVVVHAPADNDAAYKATVRSATKLTQFMNLSYPLVYDDGSVLRAVGDPRQLGITLPLYVVVDRTGKIVSYHSGFYPVDPSRGLSELESEIEAALMPSP